MRRLLNHVFATRSALKRKFDATVLDAIEAAIKASESRHGGEIRFAVEAALEPIHVLRGVAPRERALDVFAQLRVWDTDANNGVLIYVLLADRQVEIVADRGFNGRVAPQEWGRICDELEQLFGRGSYREAALRAVELVGTKIAEHFPGADRNELPDRPVLL